RGEKMSAKTDGIGEMYPLKQICNFQTETSFCASKSPLQPVKLIHPSSQSPANNVFLVFCSVDGWQTTTLEGLGHLRHILFTHFKPSIYLCVQGRRSHFIAGGDNTWS